MEIKFQMLEIDKRVCVDDLLSETKKVIFLTFPNWREKDLELNTCKTV